MYILASFCDSGSGLSAIYFIKSIVKILCIVTPILLLIFLTIDIVKAVTAGDEATMKKIPGLAVKRFAYAVAVFMVPYIVNGFMGLLGDSTSVSKCYDLATAANVEKKVEDEKKEAEIAKAKAAEERAKKASQQNNSNNGTDDSSTTMKPTNTNANAVKNLAKKGEVSSSEAIARTAEALAWPENKSKKVVEHNYKKRFTKWSQLGKARPNQAFMDAYDSVKPKHWKRKKGCEIGASCVVFVEVVLHYSGYDTNFPYINSPEKYLANSKKWKKVKKAKRGDVCVNSKHIMIYLGDKYKYADAALHNKRFGWVHERKEKACKGYDIYRAVKEYGKDE